MAYAPKSVLGFLCFSVAGLALSPAQEKPRLVIDPQGHAGMVGEVFFTPDGEELVSVGQDKTIRVWAVDDGRLLRTLRTEIADAEDGKHFAGALSPDGRWLAVGGWGMSATEDYGTITVIDYAEEKVVALLRGHADVIHALEFSPDGSLLLSASSDTTARVWKTAAWSGNTGDAVLVSEAIVLDSHVNAVYAAAFLGGNDRIVTGSFDHGLRFFDRSGEGYDEKARFADHASEITSLGASPDGKWVVTGDRAGKLLLWNAEARSLTRSLDREMGALVGTISFSPDGSQVIASSMTANAGKSAIWAIPSGEVTAEFAFHDNSTTASAWHPTDDLAAIAGSNVHAIVVFHPSSGEGVGALVGKGAAVWNAAMHSGGESEIALGFTPPSPDPTVQTAFDYEGFVLRPITTAEDAQQFHSTIPSSGDQALKFLSLEALEVGSLGKITNDYDSKDRFNVASFGFSNSDVFVGSSYFLKKYEKAPSGFESTVDYRGHEGEVRMISPSSDDRYLISGSLDQTARFWNQATGDLLASLFVASDGEWVIWTPEGYYAASPDGARYIGWHFNRGMGSLADYISGDQLHSQFYRPDVVRAALAQLRPGSEVIAELDLPEIDLGEAVAGAPAIAFLEPTGDSAASVRRLAVRVRATDEGGGIGEVRVFHEGKALAPDGPGAFRDGAFELPFTVSLAAGTNEIRAVAVSPEGVESVPAIVRITFEGAQATAKLFLLAVGVNEYQNPRFSLNYCRPDAEAFVAAVQKRAEPLVSEMSVNTLFDAEATAESIFAKLEEIAEAAAPEDIFVFAFAGHGVMSEGSESRDPEFHLVPHDVTQMYGDDEQLAEKAISGTKLRELASRIPARKQLVVLDACQSGGVVESFAVRGAAEERALAQLARSSGMYILASTRSEQFATEAQELGHGLFTYALLEGLEGKGDGNGDGKITVKEVEAYLNERVPELSEKHTGTAQYPNSFARGQDFPIGLTQ